MNKNNRHQLQRRNPQRRNPAGVYSYPQPPQANRWENDPTPAECKQSESNTNINANKTTHHAGYADNPSTPTSHPHTNNHSPSTTCSPTAPTHTYSKTPPTSAQPTEAATSNDQTKHQPASEQTAAHGNPTHKHHTQNRRGPKITTTPKTKKYAPVSCSLPPWW